VDRGALEGACGELVARTTPSLLTPPVSVRDTSRWEVVIIRSAHMPDNADNTQAKREQVEALRANISTFIICATAIPDEAFLRVVTEWSAPFFVRERTRLLFLLHPPCPRSLEISYPGWSYRCPQASFTSRLSQYRRRPRAYAARSRKIRRASYSRLIAAFRSRSRSIGSPHAMQM
jgi:hypothetical protein